MLAMAVKLVRQMEERRFRYHKCWSSDIRSGALPMFEEAHRVLKCRIDGPCMFMWAVGGSNSRVPV